jgi:hypothetical protein
VTDQVNLKDGNNHGIVVSTVQGTNNPRTATVPIMPMVVAVVLPGVAAVCDVMLPTMHAVRDVILIDVSKNTTGRHMVLERPTGDRSNFVRTRRPWRSRQRMAGPA